MVLKLPFDNTVADVLNRGFGTNASDVLLGGRWPGCSERSEGTEGSGEAWVIFAE